MTTEEQDIDAGLPYKLLLHQLELPLCVVIAIAAPQSISWPKGLLPQGPPPWEAREHRRHGGSRLAVWSPEPTVGRRVRIQVQYNNTGNKVGRV